MKWLRGLRLRFLIPVFLQLIALICVVGISYFYFSRLSTDIKTITKVEVPKIELIGSLNTSMQASIRYAWSMYASGLDLEQRSNNKNLSNEAIQKFETDLNTFSQFPQTENIKKQLEEMLPVWQQFKEAHTKVISTLDKNEPRWDEMAKYYLSSSIRDTAKPLSDKLILLTTATLQEQDEVATSLERESNIAKQMTTLFSIIAIIISTVIMIILANQSAKKITSFVENLNNSSQQVQNVSQEVNSTSRELNNGSTTAAASLEETVASLSLIMNLVKQSDDQLQVARKLSQEAKSSAENGQNEFGHLSSAMKEISESSQKISEIIAVIDDIAFQTNLLALNASVEAARAGEHGKGFAVVADAVRTLAQRSATAAKDISSLINETQGRVERGNKIVTQSEKAFFQIVDSVSKVESLSHEIAASSKEQAESITQINQALNQLDTATQNNAGMAHVLSDASEKMNSESEMISAMIADLQSEIDGQTQKGA